MAASSQPSLRSSRRVAGLHPSIDAPPTATTQNSRKAPQKRRAKHLDTPHNTDDEGRPVKKAKIEVQIESRPKPLSRVLKVAKNNTLRTNGAPKTIITPPDSAASRTTNDEDAPPKPKIKKVQHTDIIKTTKVTKHKIPKHRGSPLDKRKLRSQDGGSRFKSDLSLYFPGYEEIIGNEPKEPDFLTVDTPILILDDALPTNSRVLSNTAPKLTNGTVKRRGQGSRGQRGSSSAPEPTAAKYGMHYANLNDAQVIDFSTLEKAAKQSRDDPLPDSLYIKPHRRAERQEKQLRNIEKERAQHEKQHLERLLEGLMGPDWLKVMGVSGITESEKKDYEPKRDIFIKEVAGLVEKFKIWKEEEKRRKLEKEEKERALLAEEQAEEETAGETDRDIRSQERDGEVNQVDIADDVSDGDPPDYSDVDAWAARQLHQEAIGATGRSLISKQKKAGCPPIKKEKEEKAPLPPKPFTSFYSKPYLRAAAIGNHRRSGRSVTAFGHPIPDIELRDFEPPPEILNPEAVRARERSRRRMKRESKDAKEKATK